MLDPSPLWPWRIDRPLDVNNYFIYCFTAAIQHRRRVKGPNDFENTPAIKPSWPAQWAVNASVKKGQCGFWKDLARSARSGLFWYYMEWWMCGSRFLVPYNLIITINTGPLFTSMFRNIKAAISLKLRRLYNDLD